MAIRDSRVYGWILVILILVSDTNHRTSKAKEIFCATWNECKQKPCMAAMAADKAIRQVRDFAFQSRIFVIVIQVKSNLSFLKELHIFLRNFNNASDLDSSSRMVWNGTTSCMHGIPLSPVPIHPNRSACWKANTWKYMHSESGDWLIRFFKVELVERIHLWLGALVQCLTPSQPFSHATGTNLCCLIWTGTHRH